MDDRVAGVTGHVEHAETRSMAHGLVGELPALYSAGAHHGREEEIDLMTSVQRLECGRAAPRTHHVVAEFLQDLSCVFSQFIVVFDNENRFCAGPSGKLVRFTDYWIFPIAHTARQIDLDRRAFADFTVDLDVPGRLSRKSVDLAQP